MFAFLCVTLYFWLAVQLGSIFGALAAAGLFLFFAWIGVVGASASCGTTERRAKLERAERAGAASTWFLDPEIFKTGLRAGRAIRCSDRLQRAVHASKQPSEPERDNDSSVGLVFEGIAHHVS